MVLDGATVPSDDVLAALEHARDPGVDPALVALAWAYEETLTRLGVEVNYAIGGGILARPMHDFQMELVFG